MARLAAAVPADRRVAALAAVNALIALSLSLEGGRHASVYRFVRALRQRALGVKAPARSDAVQLHDDPRASRGSKRAASGWSDADAQETARIRARCCWWTGRSSRMRRAASRSWPTWRRRVRRWSICRRASRLAAQREELNALYVAMTRAREMLLFSRTPPRRSAGIGWWSRVLPHSQGFEMMTSAPRAAAGADGPIVVLQLPAVGSAG